MNKDNNNMYDGCKIVKIKRYQRFKIPSRVKKKFEIIYSEIIEPINISYSWKRLLLKIIN